MTEEEINSKTVPVIVHIPEDTYNLSLIVKLVDKDENFYRAEMTLGLSDIQKGKVQAEDWLDEYGTWILTDKGKEIVEDLKNS